MLQLNTEDQTTAIMETTHRNKVDLIPSDHVAVMSERFDHDFFRRSNPSLILSGQAETAEDLFRLYIENAFELRLAPRPDFSEAKYQRMNPDVASAVEAGLFACGWHHYVIWGHIEHRPVQPEVGADTREISTSSLKIEGAVDSVTRWTAGGWVWTPGSPERIVDVEAVQSGRVIGRARADQARPDLSSQGKGTGRYGFEIRFTEPALSANAAPTIRVIGPDGVTILSTPTPAVAVPQPKDSPTASIVIAQKQVEIKGAVDYLSHKSASGWAWIPERPEVTIEIDVRLNGLSIGKALADQLRQDLLQHKVGTARYGFSVSFDEEITRENLPVLSATGLSTTIELPIPNNLDFPAPAIPTHGMVIDVSNTAEGHVDLLTRWYATGWAWLPHAPSEAVEVAAVLGEKVIGRTVADLPRHDLADAGKGTGRYGFKLQFDAPVLVDTPPEFKVLATLGKALPGASKLPPITSNESGAKLRGTMASLLDDHARFTSKGPLFEEIDNGILLQDYKGLAPDGVKPLVMAFYLPQFHPIRENDKFWGAGFTEWRQLTRGLSRFPGHYQPRVPRDVGFYNLLDSDVLEKQADMAKSHGVGAFAYYYYWFNRKRVLEKPLDLHLKSNVDMPLLLIWANENWTRTWDGSESDVLLRQDYKVEDDEALVDDLIRHFRDPRYVRINGRPLFIIYNPKNIPNSADTVLRWRKAITQKMTAEPLIFMAQTFGELDPRPHGLDGAMEFPPHKLSNTLPGRATPDAYSSEFSGRVISYDDFVRVSLTEEDVEDFPLIKTAVPSWDNDCRRPNRGLTLEGAEPQKYERWLKELIGRAIDHPIHGTPIVAVNAWNEWAEGAYLEPDVYYGTAYLNATARAYIAAVRSRDPLFNDPGSWSASRQKVSVILPNYNHARFLPERIGSVLAQTLRPAEILFLDDCSSDNSVEVARGLLEGCGIPSKIVVNELNSGGVFRQWVKGMRLAQFDLIWVAETDDSADKNFLKNVIPAFRREDVLAAFGRITCIDPAGAARSDLDDYFNGLEHFSWAFSAIVPSYTAFEKDFATKNVIPNASGLVFRRPLLSTTEVDRLYQYRFAGDWYFYALVLRGGCVAYCSRARSYFRVNPASASRSAFFTERHLLEHRMIVQDMRREYAVTDDAVRSHVESLARFLPDRTSNDLLVDFLDDDVKDGQLRICIAANGFSVGGGEILPVELANKLKEAGHHITYLVVEQPGDGIDSRVRSRLRGDIPVVYWDDACEDINGFVRSYGIQVINSHNVSIDYRLFLRQVDLAVPYIVSLHGGYETVPGLLTPEFKDYLGRRVNTWLYLADRNLAFLPLESRLPERLVQSFNAVPTYQGNWVDRDEFRREHGIAPDAFVFVQCSRAIESKGWKRSVEVLQRLSRLADRQLHLVLIGDGPIAESLRSECASLSTVTLLGQVDLPVRYFKCFDMGIFPSTFEGETFPLFLIECFSVGLPVISSDIGEIPRVLAEADGLRPGLLVSHNQADSEMVADFVVALSSLVTSFDQYSALRSGAIAAAKRFSIENLVSLYQSTLTEATKAAALAS